MTTTKSLRSIISLSLALATLLGYSFINAAWTSAPANPPSNNVPAPINVGSNPQTKAGGLTIDGILDVNNTAGVNGLAVFGNQSIQSSLPILSLINTSVNTTDYRFRSDSGFFDLQADPGSDGTYEVRPMRIIHSMGQNYTSFSNQVRAAEFCDLAALNCFTAADVGNYSLNVLEAGQEGWNSFNPTLYPSSDTAPISTYPACFLTTNFVDAREDSDLTMVGGCTLTNNGVDWTLQATAQKRSTVTCKASCLGG